MFTNTDTTRFSELDLVVSGKSRTAQLNRMAIAIFIERCSGIRSSIRDYDLYLSAANQVLISLGVIDPIT